MTRDNLLKIMRQIKWFTQIEKSKVVNIYSSKDQRMIIIFIMEGIQANNTHFSSCYQQVLNILNEYENKFQSRKNTDEKILNKPNKRDRNKHLKEEMEKTLIYTNPGQNIVRNKYKDGMIKLTLRENVQEVVKEMRMKIVKVQLATMHEAWVRI